jgi:hypothetical protein
MRLKQPQHDDFQLAGNGGENVGPAVTYAAGQDHMDGFTLANQHQHMILFGGAPTLSPSGYALGGGHSIISAKYGLAADNILEANVVKPDGKLVTANANQNQDLFWAIRGGGGGTFGVVINVTVQAFESVQYTDLSYGIISAPNSTHFPEALAYMVSKFPDIVNSNIMSYSTLSPPSNKTGYILSGMFGGVGLSVNEISAVIEPLLEYVNATYGTEMLVTAKATHYDTVYEWWIQNLDTGATPKGIDGLVGSRLLDGDALSNSTLSSVLMSVAAASGDLDLYLVSGPGVHAVQPDFNSVLPAWRTSYIHAVLAVEWPPDDPTVQLLETRLLTEVYTAELRELAPDTGAYQNEVCEDPSSSRFEAN